MEEIFTILSIGLAVAAIISPICVALINNSHTKKLRIEELKHDETVKRIDAEFRLSEKRLDVEFSAKKDAFVKLFESANAYRDDVGNPDLLSALLASAHEAAALCSTYEGVHDIDSFARYTLQELSSETQKYNMDSFNNRLSNLSYSFAYELYGKNLSKREN